MDIFQSLPRSRLWIVGMCSCTSEKTSRQKIDLLEAFTASMTWLDAESKCVFPPLEFGDDYKHYIFNTFWSSRIPEVYVFNWMGPIHWIVSFNLTLCIQYAKKDHWIYYMIMLIGVRFFWFSLKLYIKFKICENINHKFKTDESNALCMEIDRVNIATCEFTITL